MPSEGKNIRVGRKDPNNMPDIVLLGIGIEKEHAHFELDAKNNRIMLCPDSEAAKEHIRINGVQIDGPTEITNQDRIVFGTQSAYLFRDPSQYDKGDLNEQDESIDWDLVQEELNAEETKAEEKKREQQEQQQAEKLKELE